MEMNKTDLELLKERQEVAYNILKEHKKNDIDEHYIMCEGVNNLSLQFKKSENNYVYIVSPYDSKMQGKIMTQHINYKKNKSVIFVLGIGLGEQLDSILENKDSNTKVIVIEESIKLLKYVLEIKNYSNWIKENEIFFAVGTGEILINQIKSYMDIMTFNIIYNQFVEFIDYDKKYVKFKNMIKKYVKDYANTFYFCIGNDIDDTLVGMKNRFDNINRFIESPGLYELLEKYGDVYKNKPAIIVASGPSLNKNILDLKKAKSKALILSCDGSVSSLSQCGIIPDAMGSVERIYKTYEAFYKDKIINEEIVCCCPPIVRKEIIECFDTKILSFFKGENFGEWLNRNTLYKKGEVWSGASVSHMLFGLAHELGCDPIILVGQDLAYSVNGDSHVNGAEVKENIDVSKVDTYVKGKNGELLPSTFIWEKFLICYEEAVRASDRRIIDATEGGALINGTEIMTLKDAISQYCNEDIPSLRMLIDNMVVNDEYINNAKESLICAIQREVENFENIIYDAKKYISDNEECLNIINSGIKNEEELERIYENIEAVELNIVKKIMKEDTIKMFYQYLIYSCAYTISSLETNEFTLESIKVNVEAHNTLLREIIKYGEKAIKLYKWGSRKII